MANYLLSVVYPADRTQPAPEELEVIGKNVGAVRDEMVEAGVWVFGGGLAPAGSATIVEARGADKLITDGPFAEGKEYLGGLCVIDVPDLDAALEWAEKQSRATTVPIEVRPFLG
jgi:hypothetical protein